MKSKKTLKIWRKAIWVVMILLIIVFVVMGLMFRQSIKQISKDPSVTSLTNEGVFRVIQVMNLNDKIHKPKEYKEGFYALKGTQEYKWLEEANERTELSEDFIRETLAGFMIEEHDYYQTIEITYPSDEVMQIYVKTENNDGDTSSQLINLNAKY